MKKFIIILYVAFCACALSCQGASQSQSYQPPMFPPSDADETWTVLHYWDNLDGAEITESAFDTAFRRWIGYVTLFNTGVRRQAMQALAEQCRSDKDVYLCVMGIAEEALYRPHSELFNYPLYGLFLEAFLDTDLLTEAERLRPEFQIEDVRRAAEGTPAPDFEMTLRDGSTTTFHALLAADRPTLIIFYDPECESCHEAMEQIRQEGLDKAFRVVTVDIEEDNDLWRRNPAPGTSAWTDAYAAEAVGSGELYSLPTTPSIYLVSPARLVLRKLPRLDDLKQ